MHLGKFKINIHMVFGLVVVIILCIFAYKAANFGRIITKDEIDSMQSDNPVTESLDYLVPLFTDEENETTSDGKTEIVLFGNSPFSDDRDSKDGIANMLAEKTGATVYNCSVPGSFMSAKEVTFRASQYAMDVFSFYWLSTVYCMDNTMIMDQALEQLKIDDMLTADIEEAVDTLYSIDFNTVDVIVLMYDGSDYLDGREMYNDSNFTDPQQFTGSMAAGIELIQQTYPNIRIIVSSPTYAYGIDENGNYISSDIQTYGWAGLSTYVIKQNEAAYQLEVSFLDNLYGSIHEDIASEYLTDNIHLNQKGRDLVTERIIYAIEKYTTIE